MIRIIRVIFDYHEEGSITIPANGLIKLDVGESRDSEGADTPLQNFVGFNNLDISAEEVGDYRVFASFEVNRQIIETNWEFVAI